MNKIKKIKAWMISVIIMVISTLCGASALEAISYGIAYIVVMKLLLVILKWFVGKGMFRLGVAYMSRITLALDVVFYIDKPDFNKIQLKATEGLEEYTEKLSAYIAIAPKSNKKKLSALAEQLIKIVDEITICLAERDKLYSFEDEVFSKNKKLIEGKKELLDKKIVDVLSKINKGEYIVSEDYIELVVKSLGRYNRKLNKLRRE